MMKSENKNVINPSITRDNDIILMSSRNSSMTDKCETNYIDVIVKTNETLV